MWSVHGSVDARIPFTGRPTPHCTVLAQAHIWIAKCIELDTTPADEHAVCTDDSRSNESYVKFIADISPCQLTFNVKKKPFAYCFVSVAPHSGEWGILHKVR